MAVLGRHTLKRYFETGDGLSNRAFVDAIDSMANLANTTAQIFNSEISTPNLVSPSVSAGELTTTNVFGSGATFTGHVRHGSGYPVLVQQATAVGTAQVAFLPPASSIVGIRLMALTPSSSEGGCQFRIGDSGAFDYYGQITVSAAGSFPVADVCAARLQAVSGAVFFAGTNSAASNYVGIVQYYRGVPASASMGQTLIPQSEGTTIGNLVNAGGLAASFDGITTQSNTQCSYLASNTSTGYIGKDWGSPKTVTGFVAYGATEDGFDRSNDGTSVTITLEGSTDNFVTSTVTLGASTPVTNAAGLVVSKLSGITTTTPYRYHRLKIDKGNAADGPQCAEAQFYEGG
jgi:hypothetical protein